MRPFPPTSSTPRARARPWDLATHVRAGHWATIMPRLMAEEMCLPPHVRTIPLVAPEVANLVGLVVGHRDPQPPLTAALVAEARALAPMLSARS